MHGLHNSFIPMLSTPQPLRVRVLPPPSACMYESSMPRMRSEELCAGERKEDNHTLSIPRHSSIAWNNVFGAKLQRGQKGEETTFRRNNSFIVGTIAVLTLHKNILIFGGRPRVHNNRQSLAPIPEPFQEVPAAELVVRTCPIIAWTHHFSENAKRRDLVPPLLLLVLSRFSLY